MSGYLKRTVIRAIEINKREELIRVSRKDFIYCEFSSIKIFFTKEDKQFHPKVITFPIHVLKNSIKKVKIVLSFQS